MTNLLHIAYRCDLGIIIIIIFWLKISSSSLLKLEFYFFDDFKDYFDRLAHSSRAPLIEGWG